MLPRPLSDRSARRGMTGKPSYENTMLFVCYQYIDLQSRSEIDIQDLTLKGKERESSPALLMRLGNGLPTILSIS
jgi:hypothetical protein